MATIKELKAAVPDRFCDYQINLGDGTGIDCEATLFEGRGGVRCPYTRANIHRGDVHGIGRNQLYVSTCLHPYWGVCQDVKFLPEVERDLRAKLEVTPREVMFASKPPERPKQPIEPVLT